MATARAAGTGRTRAGGAGPGGDGKEKQARAFRAGRLHGVFYALSAALMFGASTPFVRPALAATDPAASAGYLYLGQALFLSVLWLAGRVGRGSPQADLDRGDLLPLLGGILAGGLIAPGAFTAGLARLSAHRVSLLLGFETVFTLLIALVFRHERLSGRAWRGVGLLLAAGALVTLPTQSVGEGAPPPVSLAGSLFLLLACGGWAVDSNLTAGISGKDPTAISLLKGWAAAAGYLGGSLLLGRTISASPGDLLTLLGAGAIGYGLSLRLFILALRHIGVALTTTLFSTAPLAGFLVSVAFGERPAVWGWAALLLAGAGVAVVSRAGHAHTHVHESITHEHPHLHDEHHDHQHPEGVAAIDGHSHVHTHRRLVHTHPHEADTHHTHEH